MDWTSFGVWALFTLALTQTMTLRNTAFERFSREAWSLGCRSLFFLWFLSLWWRSENNCNGFLPVDAAERQWLFSYIPLPTLGTTMTAYGPSDCLPFDIVLFPLAQIIFYITELTYIQGLPPSKLRKDDGVLQAHHYITIFVVAGPVILLHFYWPAVFVTTLYDVSDLLLESAKLLRRRAKETALLREKQVATMFSSLCFYLFVAVWFITRVYYVPFHLIPYLWSTAFNDETLNTMWHYFFYSVFLAIQLPQIFWTAAILRAVWRSVVGGELKDDAEQEDE